MNERLERFESLRADAGVFLDYDGTLSDIVDVPSRAGPRAGVRALLADLASSYRTVAIVSGRSAAELVDWLGTATEIWGVLGAQRVVDGEVVPSEEVAAYEDTIAAALDEARAEVERRGPAGIFVEDKGVVATLHYRTAEAPDAAAEFVRALARDLAVRHGLVVAEGRMSVELRPPVDLSKAGVLRRRAREERLRAALFAGDDVVDIPAFECLDELEREGLYVLRVAVRSDEAPAELIERADLVVDGPAGLVDLLRELA